MMTIVRFGEQMIVKAMSIPVFFVRRRAMLLALYLIPQWNGAALETLSLIPPRLPVTVCGRCGWRFR